MPARDGKTPAKAAPRRPDPVKARGKLFGRQAKEIGSFAMVQPHRVAATADTVAATQIAERKPERTSQLDDEWQAMAYEYVETIGEVGYVYDLKSNLMSRCDLTPQILVELDGEFVWQEDEDPRVHRTMAAFEGPMGGQAELKRRAGFHIAVAGETYLVGTPGDGLNGVGIFWEFLSTKELRVGRDGQVHRLKDGVTSNALVADDVYVARCWRSSPVYSGLAWSAMKRVQSICRELVLLTQMVEAVAKSRLSAQILFVPEEMSFSQTDDDASEDDYIDDEDDPGDEDGVDPLTLVLMKHMAAPVTDRTSAAALVPLVLRGPYEMRDGVQIIEIARGLDTWAKDLRAEALDRLAAGIDVPKETVLGKAEVNHWSAYNIDADLVTKHVIPDGDLFAAFVTYAYMRPMLEVFEGFAPEDSARRRLAFNPGPITARQDEANSARVLHEMSPEILSDGAMLDANGFGDADVPDAEEVFRRRCWFLLTKKNGLEQVVGPVLMPELDWTKARVTPGEGGAAVTGADGLTPPDATSGAEEPVAQATTFPVLLERLATAADSAVVRAYEKAGARLVSKCQKDRSLHGRAKSVSLSRVATVVTAEEMKRMGATHEYLLAEAWDELGVRCREWVRDYLTEGGTEHLAADDRAARASSDMCTMLDDFVRDHLHTGLPRMTGGLRVPMAVIERVVSGHVLATV